MTQTHYIEIKAIPQVDMLQTEVISFCLQKLHQILPHFEGRIGLAFPAYGKDKTLGGIIRLFGSENDCGFIYFINVFSRKDKVPFDGRKNA